MTAPPGKAAARLALLFLIAVRTVVPAIGHPAAPLDSLSVRHPGDRGMAGDPSVVLDEHFSEGSLEAVLARYTVYENRAGMSLVPDHPAGSPGPYSLQLTSGGDHPSTYLYKVFWRGYQELYFRYYAKYVGSGPWHHTGVWLGGYDPPLPFPYPRAGLRPSGNDWYSIGLEPVPSFRGTPMDLYVYWRGMHSWRAAPTGARGDYFGNTLLHDPGFRLRSNTWVCYEIHLKLNPNSTSAAGAVLEVWEDDRLVRRFDDYGPLGYWTRDKFCPIDARGSECTEYRRANPLARLDQRWRTSPWLGMSYFWPQNYNDAKTESSLLLDDMVIARRRIGCIAPASRRAAIR